MQTQIRASGNDIVQDVSGTLFCFPMQSHGGSPEFFTVETDATQRVDCVIVSGL